MLSDISPESDPNESLTYDLIWLADTSTDDTDWLRRNSDKVYTYIRAGMSSEYHYTRSVEAVVSFIALIVTNESWNGWFDPIAEIIETITPGNESLFEAGLRAVLAEFRPLAGTYGKLDSARPALIDALLQAYINLFRVVIFRHGFKLHPTLIEQATAVANRLGDHMETAKLNQTLALYYAHYGDADTAEPYAKLAFNKYEFVGDFDGALDTALTMATIYRGRQRLNRADYYIRRAVFNVPPDKRDKRIATLFYEYAAICYRNDRFELALSYYERALAIFEEYEAAYQITMTHQAMSQVYLYLGKFEQAEVLLLNARSQWEALGNRYEWVNTFFIEADLELKRGNRSLGLRMLRQTIDRAYTVLEDIPARETLLTLIRDHIDRNSADGSG